MIFFEIHNTNRHRLTIADVTTANPSHNANPNHKIINRSYHTRQSQRLPILFEVILSAL